MADFIHSFWSWFVAVPTIAGLVYCIIILQSNHSLQNEETADQDVETTGHVWDEDLVELNNPLPRWWLNMFYITIIFSFIYLALYPGLGAFQGLLGWSSKARYDNEVAEVEAKHAPLYAKYLATPINDLVTNTEAMGTAKRIFANNCAICHGADAKGYTGFPNLTDDDWIFGGDETTLKTTLNNGRSAVMPPWGAALGEQGVKEVTEYVYSLSRESSQPELVAAGQQKYMIMCIACHGPTAQGNPVLGAPNLSDNTWLYGGSKKAIAESLNKGRNGIMPAFSSKLTESEIHLVTAYIRSFQK